MDLPRKMSQGGADSKHAYNALGRPVSRDGDDFGYNARSEVAWTTIGNIDAEYAYDPAGNRTVSSWDEDASTYTATGLNQYGAIITGGVTNALVHDAWGNLTGTRPFRFTYSYAGNLLVGVGTNRVNGVRAYADYDYDAQSRRAYKYVHPPSGPNRSHWYFHSGWSLQTEQWRQGNSGPYNFVHYVWGRDLSGTLDGAGGGGGLLTTEVDGTWYFPLYDNNGNVTDYVSETGEVVASYEYDAFGRTIDKSGPMADVFPFRFSTKYYDAETGLYYYGYRYYSPELGRWLTRDPIEENGGDNLYAFCGNNGVNRIDFLGLVTYYHCTSKQQGIIAKAISNAQISIPPIIDHIVSLEISKSLSRHITPKKVNAILQKQSLGPLTLEEHLKLDGFTITVLANLYRIKDMLDGGNFGVECKCESDRGCKENGDSAYGYVNVGWLAKLIHGTNINLCPEFFKISPKKQMGRIVHEATHWHSKIRTADHYAHFSDWDKCAHDASFYDQLAIYGGINFDFSIQYGIRAIREGTSE